MSSYKSVKAFCARANGERVDVVVLNAGIAVPKYEEVEGMESTVAVNVVATFLMVVLLVPVLRATAERFGGTPRLVVVASDAHEQVYITLFPPLLWSRRLRLWHRRYSKNKTLLSGKSSIPSLKTDQISNTTATTSLNSSKSSSFAK